MTQLLSSSNKLTLEQIETCINNLARVRHFTKVDKIFEGKPSYSEESIQKIKALGLEPNKVTKFANNYTIYKYSNVKESASTKLLRKYNPTAKIKNLNERIEFVIVIDSDKVDKQNYFALLALYPLIHNDLKKNKDYVMITDNSDMDETKYKTMEGGCYVTLCASNHLEQSIQKHLQTRFLPCNYKFMSLYDDVYPLLGSKTQLWCGLCSNFELMEYEELYNGYDYSTIFNIEPIPRILNASLDDLIVGTHILNEGRPYFEFTIKRVKTKMNEEELEE